jgi:tetratricopeptide (TPR) repeat protein
VLNEILTVSPTDSEIQKLKDILYTHEDENLIAYLNKIPYNYPKIAICWEDRGKLLYEINEFEEALEELDKCLEINPQDAGLLFICLRGQKKH